MPNIAVLDQKTINQIAAGEVVDRPSSVVKELIENAIDAGANAITAEISGGGISLIRITDNGAGIEKEDIALAFLRHSTSKIKTVEDLLTIGSLGFRGEALSSIAAVSQVEVITKTRASFIGSRYIIEGGKEKELQEIGCPDGTTFLVRNLFYNTPARRKYLKSATTEAGYINELMEQLALSHPEISFKFIQNNKTVLHTLGQKNLKDIIYHIYGREVCSQLLSLESFSERITIEGYLGKPTISRGNRNYENYYINGRYIKSAVISNAIEDAFKPYSMQHKYPFTVLHLTTAPEYMDVNVHPTKMELRFSNNEIIYQSVYAAVSSALAGTNLIPEVSLNQQEKERIPKGKRTIANAPEPFETNRIQRELMHNPLDSNEVQKEPLHNLQDITKLQKEPLHRSQDINEVHQEPVDSLYKIPKQISGNMSHSATMQMQPERVMEAMCYAPFVQERLEDVFLSKDAVKKHQIIGQVFSTYWLVEYEKSLYIIDQHAAHEKILYEAMVKRMKEKDFSSQMISPPIILTLNLREEETFKEYEEYFRILGYEIESFGGKEYQLSCVPADIYGLAGEDLFIEILDELTENAPHKTTDLILDRIASLSCKAAVKGNSKMNELEAKSLIDQLLSLEQPFHCPHGRPVIIAMTQKELEKKFKRIV